MHDLIAGDNLAMPTASTELAMEGAKARKAVDNGYSTGVEALDTRPGKGIGISTATTMNVVSGSTGVTRRCQFTDLAIVEDAWS